MSGGVTLFQSDPVTDTKNQSYEISNLGLAATVGSNAMTIALKTQGGTDPTPGSPVKIGFRNSTAATGTYAQLQVTAALSTVISSGSTAGSVSGMINWVYVYAINNAGTIELAWSGSKYPDEGSLITTVAEGGAGAADSKSVVYSTTARSNVAMRLIGRVKSTQATAGTWATAPSEISLIPFETNVPRSEIFMDTGNQHGGTVSGDTKIRNFSNTRKSIGTAITYTARTTTAADLFTINEDGVYTVNYVDNRTDAAFVIGITVNDTATSTSIGTPISYAQGARCTSANSTNTQAHCSFTGVLSAGDIVRAHTDGNENDTSTNVIFSIVKVSN